MPNNLTRSLSPDRSATCVRRSLAIAAVATFASFLTPAQAQIKYQIVMPEIFGDEVSKVQTHGNEINELGQTVLNRLTTFSVWKKGKIEQTISGRVPGEAIPSTLTASSINQSQQVVGSKTFQVPAESGKAFITLPFYWDPQNGLQNLEALGDISSDGLSVTHLYDISDSGHAIGHTRTYQDSAVTGRRGFLWSAESGETPIPALSSFDGMSVTTPRALNEIGTVVGTYREFLGGSESYFEKGFVFTDAEGSTKLETIDADFFNDSQLTARDINNGNQLVGEIGQSAYFYDLETGAGHRIDGFGDGASARAYAVNDVGVVAGYSDVVVDSLKIGYAPLLWTAETGSVYLHDYLSTPLTDVLPQGIDALDCVIQPKSINRLGQISAQLYTTGHAQDHSREVVLNPVLDFQWHAIQQTKRNGQNGILYTHHKSSDNHTLPLSALGLQLAFQCSPDMNTWTDIDLDTGTVSFLEGDQTVELFVPLEGCVFIRVSTKPID